jgi:hypothetical protein
MGIVRALAWTSTRVGAQDNVAREARDRAEIEALMWDYTRALDTLNPDAYAAAYTPDVNGKWLIQNRDVAPQN